jgi:hypothetical protein
VRDFVALSDAPFRIGCLAAATAFFARARLRGQSVARGRTLLEKVGFFHIQAVAARCFGRILRLAREGRACAFFIYIIYYMTPLVTSLKWRACERKMIVCACCRKTRQNDRENAQKRLCEKNRKL